MDYTQSILTNYTHDTLPHTDVIFSSDEKSFILKYVIVPPKELENTNLKDYSPSFDNNSVIIPGIYEGGLDFWECSKDLIEYLNQQICRNELYFYDKSVLDLGCGHGLCGIYSLIKGAKSVTFQDYNKEVLEKATIRNFYLNSSEISNEKISLVSGKWSTELSSLCVSKNNGLFDFILSCETIYTVENMPSVISFILATLIPVTGIAFIAAKRFYFGIGGGTLNFLEFLKSHSEIDANIVYTYKNGFSNIRDIISIKINQ